MLRYAKFLVIVAIGGVALGGCSESEKGNPQNRKEVPKGPQASHTNFCPPAPTSKEDCEEACGKVKVTFSADDYPPCLNNATGGKVWVMFHYDDCQEEVTKPYPISTTPGNIVKERIPACKCCGDQGELVCARPGIWDEQLSEAIAHSENATEEHSIPLLVWDKKANIIDEFVHDSDPNQPESPMECCADNGYYADYNASTNTVTIGCIQ